MPYMQGPWAIEIGEDAAFVVAPCEQGDETPWSVCEMKSSCGYEDDRMPWNAALISAAPDLLQALEMMCAAYIEKNGCYPLPYQEDGHNAEMQIADAAIKKAKEIPSYVFTVAG